MVSVPDIWGALTDGSQPFLIAGPCVIESEELCLHTATFLKQICDKYRIPFIFKASYDKANRTSAASFRGPGLEAGLRILARVRQTVGVPVLTDVHTEAQVGPAAEVVDVIQIPAFLCRQTDLIAAAAASGKILNLKKGQFLSPMDMKQVVQKAEYFGAKRILVTERGTTFGYNNLVADMRAIAIMRTFGWPVVFDATHSVQLPGGAGTSSSGQSEFAPVLARAAVAAGADGVFIETHPDPSRALSDGPNMIPLSQLERLIQTLIRIFHGVRTT